MTFNLAHNETWFCPSVRGVCSFSLLVTVGMFTAINNPNTVLLNTPWSRTFKLSFHTFVKWVTKKKKKNSSTVSKAMDLCFIVVLIVAQTCVYTNTDHFLSIFNFCLYNVKDQVGNFPHWWQSGSWVQRWRKKDSRWCGAVGGGVIQVQEEWDIKWRSGSSARGELRTHGTWIDDGLYPANNPVLDW